MPVYPHKLGARAGSEKREDFLEAAIKHISVDGDWAEFGVFTGSTLRFLSERAENRIIHGFDSFEGLPENWGNIAGMTKGTFALTKEQVGAIQWPANASIHKGWFKDTVPEFAKTAGPLAFVHIDSDVYSSASTVLTGLKGNIVKGTVLVFDEYFGWNGWEQGEALAFEEFLATGRHATFLAYNSMEVAAVMED